MKKPFKLINKMGKKIFKLESALSAVSGVLLCPIGEVYEVLNHLTGDTLFTHQLPRAGKVCRIPVFKQHPFLKEIDTTDINRDNWPERLLETKEKYPNEVELSPIANWTHIDPETEAIEMMGGDKSKVIIL
jgi:hypothetical protein